MTSPLRLTASEVMEKPKRKPAIVLKAFQVDDDECGVVVFAKTNAAARRLGASELDTEWEYLTCRRAPKFDDLASQGRVSPRQYMERGWWWTCSHCERRLALDDERADRFVYRGEHVYCSPWEALASAEDMAGNAWERRMGATMARLYGPANVTWSGEGYRSSDGYGANYRECWGCTFTFPGAKYGGRWDSARGVMVANGDVEAWRAFIAQSQEKAA